jgi:hypothetical protein
MNVDRRGVMVFGGNGQVFATNVSICESQTIKSLRACHFMNQVQVNVEQIWRTVFTLNHYVVIP